jgi:diguanylate cyclase (GGDEF)-like protein
MHSTDRALRTLNAGRGCLLRAKDERTLLPELCHVIVDIGGYRAAWVGSPEASTDRGAWLLACAGGDPTVIASLVQPVSVEGPSVTRMQLSEAVPKSTRQKQGGFGAALHATFPLRTSGGGLIGHLGILAAEPDAFDDEPCKLLGELMDDLSLVLADLRARGIEAHSQQLLLRADRALRTLSAGNRTLLRAQDEKELLHEMCRVVVEEGGYSAAGVGYAEKDERKTIRPMAWAGIPTEVVQQYHFTWADTEAGQQALGIAIRTGQPSVGKQVLEDPAYAYLLDASLKLGYTSSSAFPLRVDGEVIGCLGITAAEPDAFAEDELRVLTELADDLSFGIATQRLRVKHRAAEQAIERMAYCDALTGLPNRTALHEQLLAGISEARQQRRPLALLLLKVGQFQEINDTLGYQEGDALLRETALRLRRLLGNSERVARVGEDEFAVLLPCIGSDQAAQVAQQLLMALRAPVELAGLSADARVYIGIAFFPGHGTDPDALIRRANVAAYHAKRNSSGYAMYAGGVDRECASRLALMADLRRAIDHNELLLYCQPKVRMESMVVCGAEALVRWLHPRHGMIPTGEFIKLAENSGLITPLTHWVLEAAFRQSYDWSDAGVDCPLSVNLSAHDLRDPRLLDHIKGLFSTWGTKPQSIQFEITESALMDDPVGALEALTSLKNLGVELYIDDFGIGYSSLSYLQKLPVDAIKIDQSFVSNMLASDDSAIIVRSTIDLGHNLKRGVVAEGVESQALWERLRELECDTAQGYFIGEPMPAELFREWRERSSWRDFQSSGGRAA